ncbi:hypothetical protein NX871_27490 [Burkholderia thailandensis]|uniref:hypothetical protein n=1 Tax=Burkholderia thailandensis TaxID=57975 RepID=UPI00217F0E95|nr:hypothetical protein [Burkholderia thailandensis]MCS6473658.1 hypothetical protein [Burkholderia thailandensis]
MPSVIATLKQRWAARLRSITKPSPAARYANKLIRGGPDRFDAIEVHGVRQFPNATDPARTYCEIDSDNPQFFSVYLHCVEGGVMCCADLPTRRKALHYARAIARRYCWSLYDHCPTTPRDGAQHPRPE